MIKTNFNDIVNHLQNDLSIESEALVWLHSGVIGMGVLEEGIITITNSVLWNIQNSLMLIVEYIGLFGMVFFWVYVIFVKVFKLVK